MSLQGTLSTLGITDLLEFLAERTYTGQLDVKTEAGSASYLLVNGTVGVAEYQFIRGSGSDAATATYYVLAELDGEFMFDEVDDDELEDGEDVGTLLGRTAGIAGRWLEIEKEIPTVGHVLVRNSEIDSSVTIEPEWWKILEVLGSGQTGNQLAEKLDLEVLEASTQALAMKKAGLLVVSDEAPIEQAPAPAAIEEPAPAAVIEEPAPAAVIEESAPAIVEEAAPVDAPAPPVMAEPVDQEIVDTPAPAEEEGGVVLGFSRHVEADPAPAAPAASPAVDDGWSTNPFAETEGDVAAAQPVEQPGYLSDPVIEETPAATMSFDSASFDSEPDAITSSEAAPLSFDASPIGEADDSDVYGLDTSFSESEPVESAPAAEQPLGDFGEIGEQDFEDPVEAPVPAQASPIAEAEVVEGLNNPAPAVGESDPFGSLSDLVVDDAPEEDRGSVLKFLRRD